MIDEELFEFHSVLRHPLPGFEVLVKQSSSARLSGSFQPPELAPRRRQPPQLGDQDVVLALTRFAGQPDYAASAAVCWWMVVASYSTGVM